jgi:two-component sensor histidine kinase
VSWATQSDRLTIVWTESDGPPVAQPTRRGFGTTFIGRVLRSVDGTVETEFNPAGVRCVIAFSLRP